MTNIQALVFFGTLGGLSVTVYFHFLTKQLFKETDKLAKQINEDLDRFRTLLRTLDELEEL